MLTGRQNPTDIPSSGARPLPGDPTTEPRPAQRIPQRSLRSSPLPHLPLARLASRYAHRLRRQQSQSGAETAGGTDPRGTEAKRHRDHG